MTDHTFPIDELLRRLHLANARRTWRALASRAEKESWSYEHFLGTLVAEEVAHRKGTRLRRLSSVAHFPFLKTIDDFDFTFQSTLRLQMLGSYLSPDFVTQGGSLILIGKTGRGKTHLAIAIAYRAIQNGFDARFVTAAELIDELALASREGRLREALTSYTRPDVLVVDEVGYLAHDPDAANVLFHVVNERHLKKRAMVFTTNKELSVWGQVLHDNDLGEAIVDRILERGRLIRLDGPSVRSRHLDSSELSPLGAESPAPEPHPNRPEFPERLRPEFPEPTNVHFHDSSLLRLSQRTSFIAMRSRSVAAASDDASSRLNDPPKPGGETYLSRIDSSRSRSQRWRGSSSCRRCQTA